MGFVMGLNGFFVMVLRVQMMSVCELCMMSSFFVMACLSVLRCFPVVLGRVLVVISRFRMMAVRFLVRHRSLPETSRLSGSTRLSSDYDSHTTINLYPRFLSASLGGVSGTGVLSKIP